MTATQPGSKVTQRAAGLVLCGGASRRMGHSKAELPFGSESMLARMIRLLEQAVEPVIVVCAVEQRLPPIPDQIQIATDRRPDQGPLEGIASGLSALADRADVVFAAACDLPLLTPEFVNRVIELLGDHDAAVPVVDGYYQPLAAAYRTSRVLPNLESMLAAGQRQTCDLFDRVKTRQIPKEEFEDVDPHGWCLRNCNHPDDYLQALAFAGFSVDPQIRASLSNEAGAG